MKTLGCKVNQYEGEQLRAALAARGYRIVPFEAEAEVYVVNSCTVTATSDRDTRRLARQARRRSPGALVAVTGCYAQVAARELGELGIADVVVGSADRGGLVEQIAERVPVGQDVVAAADPWGEWGPLVRGLEGHTRAFIKVQEGCDAHCTYCIVPTVRGPGRSVPTETVMAQVEQLVEAGRSELVLHPLDNGI